MTAALTDTARVAAQLLARRQTPQNEVGALLRSVHLALAQLNEPRPRTPEAIHVAPIAQEAAKAAPRVPRRPARAASIAPPEAEEPAAPPPPKLRRRAEVIGIAPASEPTFEVPSSALRGIVKWFDTHTRRGALRLPGYGGDIPVDAALLSEMGVTRLYKGQEVEAMLSDDAEPRVVRLALPGGAAPTLSSSGVVRSRQAKPVVVELKREAMRRVASRAEAELLLRPGRSR